NHRPVHSRAVRRPSGAHRRGRAPAPARPLGRRATRRRDGAGGGGATRRLAGSRPAPDRGHGLAPDPHRGHRRPPVRRRVRPRPARHPRPLGADRRRPDRGGDRLHRLRRRAGPSALRGRVRGRSGRDRRRRVPRRRAGARLARHPAPPLSPEVPMTDAPAQTKDHVLAEVVVPAPAAAVWRALREPALIREWFGWQADSLAEEIEFIFVTHAAADEAAGVIDFEGVPDRYEIEARDGGAAVRVVRRLPADAELPAFDGMVEGWISFTWQLAFALARHDLAPRRTLFF